MRETRRRRGRRRQWRWRYRWRRRCRGTPLRGRGPTCPDMLLCSTFRSDPIWSAARKCDFDFWISQCSSADFFFSFFCEKRSVLALSLSRSQWLAWQFRYAVCANVRLDLVDLWSFALGFFSSERPALCFGVELIKKREKWNGNVYKGDKIKISTKFYKVMLLNFSLTLEFFFFYPFHVRPLSFYILSLPSFPITLFLVGWVELNEWVWPTSLLTTHNISTYRIWV